MWQERRNEIAKSNHIWRAEHIRGFGDYALCKSTFYLLNYYVVTQQKHRALVSDIFVITKFKKFQFRSNFM